MFLGVIHRIDRPVSGVVVFARTSKALERMNKLFHDREIDKTYWAVTANRPDPLQGHLVHYLTKDTTSHQSARPTQQSQQRRQKSRVGLRIDHAGRRQLSAGSASHHGQAAPDQGTVGQNRLPHSREMSAGFPVLHPGGSILLHCRSLSFEHPIKKERVRITAHAPDDQIWRLFGK